MDTREKDLTKNPSDEICNLIQQTVRDFATLHIKPHIRTWDEQQHFPKELFKAMGELGLMGMLIPESLGGAGLGYREYVTAIIELAKVDPSVA